LSDQLTNFFPPNPQMGQGDGKRFPVFQLIERFGEGPYESAWRSHGNDVQVLQKLIRFGKIPEDQDIVVLLDMPQTIEKANYVEFQTGLEVYESTVRPRILSFLGIPQVKTVIVCMDCTKNQNRAKEMCYYTLSGSRRLGVVPIDIEPGQVFLDDRSFPVGKWTEFKSCEVAYRQLNHYFAQKFAMETLLPQADGHDYSGEKKVFFDNCIRAQDLFSTADREMVPYHAKEILYFDGNQAGVHETQASEISEGEYAMSALVTSFAKMDHARGVRRAYVCITTDQDIIPLSLLGHEYRCVDGDPVCDVFTLMQSKSGGAVGTTVVDVNRTVSSICTNHRHVVKNENLPVEVEVALFLLGGCDNFKKPFYRIGYCKDTRIDPSEDNETNCEFRIVNGQKVVVKRAKRRMDDTIHFEFVDKLRLYAGMFRKVKVAVRNTLPEEQRRDSTSVPDTMDILDIDLEKALVFAKNLFRRKSRSLSEVALRKKVADVKESLFVTLRNLMFTILYMKEVPRVRALGRTPINISPFLTDQNGVSVWGYKEGEVEGAPQGRPVCVPAERVAHDFFVA